MVVVFVDNVRRCSDGPRPLGGSLTKYQAQCEAAVRAVEFTMGKGALGHAESFKLISPEQHLAAYFNGTNKPGPKIKEHADRFIKRVQQHNGKCVTITKEDVLYDEVTAMKAECKAL